LSQRLRILAKVLTYGSQNRIAQALNELGYHVPNTSAIERRNGTARLMSKAQVRKTLAFAKREDQKTALGWWAVTVYNWCRPHRSLQCPLPEPQGKKVSATHSGNGYRPGKFYFFSSRDTPYPCLPPSGLEIISPDNRFSGVGQEKHDKRHRSQVIYF
jgi:hypothetical protein